MIITDYSKVKEDRLHSFVQKGFSEGDLNIMGSVCTKVAPVTTERTYFIQPQNIQICKTDIKRKFIKRLPHGNFTFLFLLAFERGQCHNKKK